MAFPGPPGFGAGAAAPGPTAPGVGAANPAMMGGGMPPGAAAPPPGAASPVPPLAPPFTDLSMALPPHYQLLDVAHATLQQAIETGGFYQTPAVLAALREISADLKKLIVAAARANRGEMEAPQNVAAPDAGNPADVEPQDEDTEPDEKSGEAI